jgi:CcmD family protein
MIDAEFVFAAYGVIFGGLGLYALALARRLRAARRRAGIDDDGEGR